MNNIQADQPDVGSADAVSLPRADHLSTMHSHTDNNNIQETVLHLDTIEMGVIEAGRPAPGIHRPILVLLHGFTGSARAWGSLLTDITALDFHVIALDMPGHGQSSAPDDIAPYRIENTAASIIAALQTLGVERGQAILLGYSMGGRIALSTAFSGYFRALILESASPGLLSEEERSARRASDHALADRIERKGVTAFVDYWERIPLFASQDKLGNAQKARLREQRLHNRAHGLANSLRGVGTGEQPSLQHRLPELSLPVLLITGQQDHKFCAIAAGMQQGLPSAILAVVPGAGHTVHLEQPTQFIAHIQQFCVSLQPE